MEPNRGERTVLKYVKLDFVGDWEYYGDSFSFRPVGRQQELIVVREGATGMLETYWFVVRRRPDLPDGGINTTDWVIVPREENIVYIPERCVRRECGDHTKCGDQRREPLTHRTRRRG
jgi:hypothetical protein